MELMKNKAIDLVNSEKECDQAIICKDMITDQWSLTLYYMKEKTYKFVTYVWDEIDDNWQKSFWPISGRSRVWKSISNIHLRAKIVRSSESEAIIRAFIPCDYGSSML